MDAWKKVSPNIDPPKTPLSFMKPRPLTPAVIPSKLTVNFVLPYQSEISSKEVWFGLLCALPDLGYVYCLFDLVLLDLVARVYLFDANPPDFDLIVDVVNLFGDFCTLDGIRLELYT